MKKKSTIFALLLLISIRLYPQNKPALPISAPAVDERIELTSIASRLAEYDEYSNDANKTYVKDIHNYFDRYKNHPLIKYLQMVRDSDEIGFDAIPNVAVHLSQSPAFLPVVPFTDKVPDRRWKNGDAVKLLPLLRQFYKDTHFDIFFKKEQPLYKKVISQFDSLYRLLDVSWYPRYYGVPAHGSFHVVVAPGNGGANYGPKVVYPAGREERYAIMGVWRFREDGVPTFKDADYLPTLIHEFNHSFVNHLTERHQKELENAGQTIFGAVSGNMKRLAYGDWEDMMSEALVRASVIRYLKSHNPDSAIARSEIQKQVNAGFVWMPALVDLLGTYEANRKAYPDLNSFMPHIVEFYRSAAANIQSTLSAFAARRPHVIAAIPQLKGDSSVSDTVTRIKITFDKPLTGKGYSVGRVYPYEYPAKFIGYADDNKAIILGLKLKPGVTYAFNLLGLSFMSVDGYPVEEYEVKFRTKNK